MCSIIFKEIYIALLSVLKKMRLKVFQARGSQTDEFSPSLTIYSQFIFHPQNLSK